MTDTFLPLDGGGEVGGEGKLPTQLLDETLRGRPAAEAL